MKRRDTRSVLQVPFVKISVEDRGQDFLDRFSVEAAVQDPCVSYVYMISEQDLCSFHQVWVQEFHPLPKPFQGPPNPPTDLKPFPKPFPNVSMHTKPFPKPSQGPLPHTFPQTLPGTPNFSPNPPIIGPPSQTFPGTTLTQTFPQTLP